jgi:uncharacterized membrane protein
MPTVEHTVKIRAPIEAVFTAATDPKRAPEWNPNVIEVRDVTYPLQEGSTWKQITVVMGRQVTLNCRVVRFGPPHEGDLEVSGDLRGRIWTRCQSDGTETQVTQGIEFEPPGGSLVRMAAGLLRPTVQRELKQSMERQRTTLEQESGGIGGSGTA